MALPTTMQAQVLNAFNTPYELTTRPIPPPPTGHDILIRVHAASYCHTDAVYASGAMGKTLPLVPCHEFAGTVVALGPAVPASSTLQIGTRVGVPGRAYHPCGRCKECENTEDESGYSVYCPKAGNNGISRDGGFQQYTLVDARQVVPMPEALSFVETAPLMCAGLTVFAALKRCNLQPGDAVGIVGCGGGLGHLGVQFALEMGYRVIGVDNGDAPLRLARSCVEPDSAAAHIFDARTTDADAVLASLAESTGAESLPSERGIPAVLILPESQAAFSFGMSLLRPHGRCVVVSFPEKGFAFSAKDLVFKDVEIVGSLVGSNRCAREMLQLAARSNVRARVRTWSLEALNELVEAYKKGEGGKLVVDLEASGLGELSRR
ncbi:hypothetical protein HO133_008254 [Letharia lupina]|uniref:Enoyl reductase (ER) domain-containing protein n=1 Tax=Letharia lupina TaxID=560253 RepID=A0A8H6CRU5_9LECA|nr:uncharacterized protein HO133_008254 [Letharia lupina]KAF6228524.1 hypothetical protein HO133_008254 [Letharia lupina]